MKNCFIILFIITIICITSSCSDKSTKELADLTSTDDYFQYSMNETIYDYDIDEDDNLYYMTSEKINVMSPEGTLVKSYLITNHIQRFCIIDDHSIIHTSDTSNGISLHKLDLETQISEKICDFKDYTEISKIEVSDDRLYFIGKNKNYFDKKYSLASADDQFSYGGQKVGYVDIKNGDLVELPIELPLSFSTTIDGNMVVYGYDESGGYHFSIFNKKDSSLSNPIYHNLGLMQRFEIYNEDNDFMYVKLPFITNVLTAASLSAENAESELLPNYPMKIVHNLKTKGGYTYCDDSLQLNVIRINNSAYLRGNKKITMLTTKSNKSATPFGCGFNINRKTVTNEEMALKVLSQDNDFDIVSIHSKQDISENIRNKSSFYPLNKVPGVKEYLDSCFPYIKEVATNDEGDIWMIPIMVDINFFIYHEEVCKEYGIEFSDDMDVSKLFDMVDGLYQDKSKRELYGVEYKNIIDDLLYQYIRSYNSFKTDAFRNLANASRNKFNYIEKWYDEPSRVAADLIFYKEDYDFIFCNPISYKHPLLMADITKIRASKVPSLTDDRTNTASCFFISVNPASKNIKETLKYITSLCEYLQLYNESIIYKDRDRYPKTQVMDDLYEIYSNGNIQFTYSNEIFRDDFEKYFEGKLDLESVIQEADRKLHIFLNE